jgi:hypothetical protein
MTEDQLRKSIRLEIEERKSRHGELSSIEDIADLFDGLEFDREAVRSMIEEELGRTERPH